MKMFALLLMVSALPSQATSWSPISCFQRVLGAVTGNYLAEEAEKFSEPQILAESPDGKLRLVFRWGPESENGNRIERMRDPAVVRRRVPPPPEAPEKKEVPAPPEIEGWRWLMAYVHVDSYGPKKVDRRLWNTGTAFNFTQVRTDDETPLYASRALRPLAFEHFPYELQVIKTGTGEVVERRSGFEQIQEGCKRLTSVSGAVANSGSYRFQFSGEARFSPSQVVATSPDRQKHLLFRWVLQDKNPNHIEIIEDSDGVSTLVEHLQFELEAVDWGELTYIMAPQGPISIIPTPTAEMKTWYRKDPSMVEDLSERRSIAIRQSLPEQLRAQSTIDNDGSFQFDWVPTDPQ